MAMEISTKNREGVLLMIIYLAGEVQNIRHLDKKNFDGVNLLVSFFYSKNGKRGDLLNRIRKISNISRIEIDRNIRRKKK